jgi:hypothetical protein
MSNSRLMKTCTNILTLIGRATPVAQATRREWLSVGSMFNQGLSVGWAHYPKTNSDSPMVSR